MVIDAKLGKTFNPSICASVSEHTALLPLSNRKREDLRVLMDPFVLKA